MNFLGLTKINNNVRLICTNIVLLHVIGVHQYGYKNQNCGEWVVR